MENVGTGELSPAVLRDILSSPNITWPDDDLVFVIDALDVWLQLPPADLVRRFESYDQEYVYVGAEKHCVPNPWDSVGPYP